MLAGASAVQVGTATFVRPMTMLTVIDGLVAFCRRKDIARVADLTGAVRDVDMKVETMGAVEAVS